MASICAIYHDFRLIRSISPQHLRKPDKHPPNYPIVCHRDVVQEIGATIDDSRAAVLRPRIFNQKTVTADPEPRELSGAAPDHLTSSLQHPKLW